MKHFIASSCYVIYCIDSSASQYINSILSLCNDQCYAMIYGFIVSFTLFFLFGYVIFNFMALYCI